MPESAIAQTPLDDRAASRLLVLPRNGQPVEHRVFRELPDLLHEGDLLIRNDARVTAVRIAGYKSTGAKVEALVLSRLAEPDTYLALMKPAKRLQTGAIVDFGDSLRAEVLTNQGHGSVTIRLHAAGNVHEALLDRGTVPLPHYIHEPLLQPERYQTVYAQTPGSAAAPTAGLHFTSETFIALTNRGVDVASVSLDVGIDTFRPLTADDPREHQMHGETCELSEETAQKIANCRGRIITVGTTTTRTVESFAVAPKRVQAGRQNTRIFIYPSYEYKIVDGLITNFHMPKTSMLLMLAALVGRNRVMEAYQVALAENYRFLSFGDAMLIL